MKDPEKDAEFRREAGAETLAKQDRTEANEPVGSGKKHVPYAQMGDKAQKQKAPGKDEHDAAGQGLSG